jgi:hypothetical protein
VEPEVKGKWGSAGANAGRRTWRTGGQIEHERRSWGLTGVALELITAPVYVAAAAAQLAGRPLTYVVTAKGSAATGDSVRTFRAHLGWAGLAAGSVPAGVALSHSYPSLYFWAAVTLLVTLTPVVLLLSDKLNANVFPASPRRCHDATRLWPIAGSGRCSSVRC